MALAIGIVTIRVIHDDQFLMIKKCIAGLEVTCQIYAASVAESATINELLGGELGQGRILPARLPGLGLPIHMCL